MAVGKKGIITLFLFSKIRKHQPELTEGREALCCCKMFNKQRLIRLGVK
jgi:hypothetical protein